MWSPDKIAILALTLPVVLFSLCWLAYTVPSIYRAYRR